MLWLAACQRPPQVDVVLVSLDTTRADAIGPRVTPKLDALATSGVRFEMALAHAPTTLSSHSSAFTGLDPHGHGVPRNGFELDPSLPTLGERFAAAGYQTIGVVGASVLAAETGISRGFSTWDEHFSADLGPREERRADEVTDRALELWAQRDPDRPSLLFVHYFDAHSPYDAPGAWERRFSDPAYAGPVDGSPGPTMALAEAVRTRSATAADLAELRARYEGELGFVDEQVGRLLAGLGDRPRHLVVFADHGEGLGEDSLSPIGHGADVDLWAIHVPWLMTGPGLAPRRVAGMVRVEDIGPTVLDLVGLPTVGEGRSRRSEALGGEHLDLPSFAEANQPVPLGRRDRWPNLDFERAVAHAGHLLVVQPLFQGRQRLYALRPEQPWTPDPATAEILAAKLRSWDAAAPPPPTRKLSEKTRDALEALGYAEPE